MHLVSPLAYFEIGRDAPMVNSSDPTPLLFWAEVVIKINRDTAVSIFFFMGVYFRPSI
jgi:hypothetical protein